MMPEYAVVRLKRVVLTVPLQVGTKGTILIVHPCSPPVYEVEFIDTAGRSLGVYTVEERFLEEVENN